MFKKIVIWALDKADVDVEKLKTLLDLIEFTKDGEGNYTIYIDSPISITSSKSHKHDNLIEWASRKKESDISNKSIKVEDNATGQENS